MSFNWQDIHQAATSWGNQQHHYTNHLNHQQLLSHVHSNQQLGDQLDD